MVDLKISAVINSYYMARELLRPIKSFSPSMLATRVAQE
jgi:hypothetical protein